MERCLFLSFDGIRKQWFEVIKMRDKVPILLNDLDLPPSHIPHKSLPVFRFCRGRPSLVPAMFILVWAATQLGIDIVWLAALLLPWAFIVLQFVIVAILEYFGVPVE